MGAGRGGSPLLRGVPLQRVGSAVAGRAGGGGGALALAAVVVAAVDCGWLGWWAGQLGELLVLVSWWLGWWAGQLGEWEGCRVREEGREWGDCCCDSNATFVSGIDGETALLLLLLLRSASSAGSV